MKISFILGLFSMVLLSITACDPESKDDSDEPDLGSKVETGDTELGYNPCDRAEKVGKFLIDLAEEYTGVEGEVLDGVVPQNNAETLLEDGECRLLGTRNLFCDPACIPPETCNEEGTCILHPESQSVGTVTVTGMKIDIVMEPAEYSSLYFNPSQIPHPGFDPGADIRLAAEGGDFDPFVLLGAGIGPVVVEDKEEEIPLESDEPLTLTWEAPSIEGPARMHIELNINHHGGTPKWIECDVADTGSFTITAEFITELVGLGLSGFPNVVLSRRTADSVEIAPGCVELIVATEIVLPIQVPGLVSCADDTDCSDGQICLGDLTCG